MPKRTKRLSASRSEPVTLLKEAFDIADGKSKKRLKIEHLYAMCEAIRTLVTKTDDLNYLCKRIDEEGKLHEF